MVREQDAPHVAHVLAACHQPDRGKSQALLEDVDRVGCERAHRHAPDLGDVGDDPREPHERALVEDGLDERVLGKVGAAVVGVVRDDHVARVERVPADLLEQPAHAEERGRDQGGVHLGLGDQLPLGVEEHAGEVEPLVEDRRVGRPPHRRGHLAADRPEGVVDHGERDLVEWAGGHVSPTR